MSSDCHVLIAEDEEHLIAVMSLVLQGMGCKVSKANSGTAALDVLKRERAGESPIDLLITDIQMPEMTGDELIRQIRLVDNDLPILVMTGFGTKELLVTLMRYGCQNYLDKPFRKADFVEHVSPMLSRIRELKARKASEGLHQEAYYAEDYKKAFDDLKDRFRMAAQAVHTILSFDQSAFPFELAFHQQQLSDLGGDYVGVLPNGNGWDILLVDVAGHDMAATMYALLVKTYFEENARQGRSGTTLMKALNSALCQNQFLEDAPPRQASAVFIHLDLEARKLKVINGGHPPAYHIHQGLIRPLTANGPLLGMFPDEIFESDELALEEGDRLFLYTDGILNASRVDGPTGKKHALSYNGIDELLKRGLPLELKTMVESIWQGVIEFCRYRIEDDLTLLAFEVPKE